MKLRRRCLDPVRKLLAVGDEAADDELAFGNGGVDGRALLLV